MCLFTLLLVLPSHTVSNTFWLIDLSVMLLLQVLTFSTCILHIYHYKNLVNRCIRCICIHLYTCKDFSLTIYCVLTDNFFCCEIYYFSPHKMGRHIVFSSVVCPSVRQSVSPSVTFSCPLYIFWTLGGIFK